MQDKTRNFYDDFGTRIRVLRRKRGLTLAHLGAGKPSTAKSWESGIKPRPDEWQSIADRLQVSVSLVFLGEPKTRADCEFVAKFADEIGPPKTPISIIEEPETVLNPHHSRVQEAPAAYGAGDLEAELRRDFDTLLWAAKHDPKRLGWIAEQLRAHLAVPRHWITNEEANQRARELSAAHAAEREREAPARGHQAPHIVKSA